jgi:hypothetical protein
MSLLYDPDNSPRKTLAVLWQAAHAKEAQEAESLSFWQHLFSKHEFKEDYWICDAEIRPAPGSRKRVDRGIRFVSTGQELIVLCWHEAKDKESPSAIKECETQALRACQDNLQSHNTRTSSTHSPLSRRKGKPGRMRKH